MSDRELVGWTLAALGIASVVAGAYRTGTTGDVHVLLITGLGATTIWLAVHEELTGSGDGPTEAEPEGSP